MTDQDLTFTSAGHRLVGTLTAPAADPRGLVVLIGGSGPLDRDGNTRGLRLDIQRQLAAALSVVGWASFRYDRRGAGASQGKFATTGMTDNIDDAAAALVAAQAHLGMAADRTVLAGHSEGAAIAAVLVGGRGIAVGGVILLSPFARPGAELLLWQVGQVEPSLPALVRGLVRLFRVDLVDKVRRNHDKIRRTTTDVAWIGGARVNAAWAREFLDHDPRADLDGLAAVPTLALTGAKDLQVPPGDLVDIAERSGARTHVVEDLSHILRTQPGTPSVRAYRKDARRPIDDRVVIAIVSWLEDTIGGDTRPAPGGHATV